MDGKHAELVLKAIECKKAERVEDAIAALEGKIQGRRAGAEKRGRETQGFMTIAEAMEFLRLSRTQLWKLRRVGLPSYRIGRKILLKADELVKWIEGRQLGGEAHE